MQNSAHEPFSACLASGIYEKHIAYLREFWLEPNLKIGETITFHPLIGQVLKIREQIVLSRLTERQPVDCEAPFQPSSIKEANA